MAPQAPSSSDSKSVAAKPTKVRNVSGAVAMILGTPSTSPEVLHADDVWMLRDAGNQRGIDLQVRENRHRVDEDRDAAASATRR